MTTFKEKLNVLKQNLINNLELDLVTVTLIVTPKIKISSGFAHTSGTDYDTKENVTALINQLNTENLIFLRTF